jgi:hypothetical protein
MRSLFFLALLLIFTSCEKQDLCDLSQYPSPPYSNPDDTIYGETYVRYLYVCFNESGYNKIYTYTMSEKCWTVNIEDDYNWNCP